MPLVDQEHRLQQATDIVESRHGTRAEFTGGRTSAIITPITEANQATAEQVAQRVSDGTRGREIQTAAETLNGLIEAGTSVADLLTYINTELVPLWGQDYDDMIDDLSGSRTHAGRCRVYHISGAWHAIGIP